MSNLLEKLKKIDKRILGGVGIGFFLVIALIVGWIVVGNDRPANDIDKQNDIKVNQELETEKKDSQNQTEQEDEIESENQTQDSDNSNGSESSALESSDDSNAKNEQSDKKSETKTEDKTSTSDKKPSSEQKLSEDNKKDESNKSENSNNNSNNDSQDDSEETPATETYTVNVYSAGGHRMYNVKVNVYADSSMKELVTSASTNSSGKATLKLVPSTNYAFMLSNVAEGYQLKSSYTFSGKTATVILESSPIRGKDISATKFKVGDVMYDFSVTNARGQTITLSELLKTKKMVMLNFWYVKCEFCVAEFPAMSSAYSKYAKNIEIIALNPFDNMDAVKEFLNENPLRFQVATCSSVLPNAFGVKSYPVSIIVDRYGVIREIENGAILEEQGFIDLFNKYAN